MSQADIGEPPAKKRRFFADDSPLFTSASDHNTEWAASETSLAPVSPSRHPKTLGGPGEDSEGPSASTSEFEKEDARNDVGNVGLEESFDIELFSTIIGEHLPSDDVRRIRHHAQDDLQRAVNIYFDGSWRALQKSEDLLPREVDLSPTVSSQGHAGITQQGQDPERPHSPPRKLSGAPESRYIGAFGVAGWATRSGSNFIGHGQEIRIERQKTQTATSLSTKSGKSKAALSSRGSALNKRNDIIVRFTNSNGEEIGRLPKETASWVSTLIDQGTCRFQGTCVYAPEKIRTNDTIYLQLRAFILKGAFEPGSLNNLADNNRTTGIFEAKETDEEKRLRLRQVALVKLFEEINLNPSRTSETTQKHKRQGLLRAAEIAEQYDQENGDKGNRMNENDGSSPPSDGVEDGKELEQDQLDSLYKKAQSFDFNTPTIDPPETFIMDLRQYQKQALYWMVGKEKDEQTQHRAVSMHPLWEEYTWPTQDADDSDLPEVADQSKFYVNFYSGELSLDFPVQEQQCPGGILADEMGLGKTIEMLSLMHSHKPAIDTFPTSSAFNGLPRMPKKSQGIENAPCTTLVIAPMSLLAQWQSEAEKASKQGTLKTLVYYGNDRSVDLQTLCCTSNAISAPNLVITSYGTVLSEYNQAMSDRASYGGLFSLNFFRIILDEAHHIKNRQSKTAKACYELQAEHRWCLTGTPIVNRLEDLFSLVRFLKVEPWSNFSFWKTFITTPFEAGEFIRALDVVQTVLEPLVLRRTKDMKTPEGQALVPLPPRTIQIEEIELSKPEREVYDYIFTRAKRTFAANVEAGTLLKSYTTIFAQILRLRQSCCHPTLTRNKAIAAEEEEAAAAADAASGLADDMDLQVLINQFMADDGDEDANKFGANVLQQIQEEAENECPICSEEPMIDQTVTSCWHSACKKCLLDYIDHQRDNGKVPICFNCREPISQRDIFEVVRHDDLYDEEGQLRISLRRLGSTASAKIAALIAHLKRLRKEDPTMKSVVFSQFTSFLDLIEPALTRDHIPFLRFDGSMAQKQRAAVLNEFASSNKGVIFLLSLRAGGVGLNLTHAKRVFMMDPWWSFAVEAQAIDRVHRMGQEDPVTIHRFIVKESVEGRMLKIQDRKKFIASSLGMMSDEEKKLQRIEDIRELLS